MDHSYITTRIRALLLGSLLLTVRPTSLLSSWAVSVVKRFQADQGVFSSLQLVIFRAMLLMH